MHTSHARASDREDTVFQIWDRWGPPYDGGGGGVPPDVNCEDLKGSAMRFANYPMCIHVPVHVVSEHYSASLKHSPHILSLA